LIIQFKFI